MSRKVTHQRIPVGKTWGRLTTSVYKLDNVSDELGEAAPKLMVLHFHTSFSDGCS